jgi:hypothetical protein
MWNFWKKRVKEPPELISVDWPIEPYKSIGPIRLGMTIEEVRKTMNCEFRSFKKHPIDEFPTDEFSTRGAFVYYKPPGICEGVELAQFGNPSPMPVILGQRLLGVPFSVLLAWFRERDPDIEVDGDGLVCRKYGIGLYADGVEPDLAVEAVGLFEEGYWDPAKMAIVEAKMRAYYAALLEEPSLMRGKTRNEGSS